MIVAGFGFRKGARGTDLVEAFHAALADRSVERGAVTSLATSAMKAGEAGMVEATRALSLPVVGVDAESLTHAGSRTLTRSARSLEATGTPSLAEASALAAAGEGSTLIGPRITTAVATCALARSARP